MKSYIFGLTLVCGASLASAQAFGPAPYLQTSDSPWAGLIGNGSFFLENFEDGLFNTPGVTASAGSVIGPGGLTDSVDGDDGSVNGSGTQGRSFFTGAGNTGIRFTFNATTLGQLPTHAALAWTDGAGTIRFEAFDANNVSLGVITGNHAGSVFSGQTDEDRLYGWVHAGGIKSILMSNSSGGLEVDHLQYGVVPEPASAAVLGLGMLLLARRNRK